MDQYGAVNRDVVKLIPETATNILDIGCGNGALGALLKQQNGAKVTGITFSEKEFGLAMPLLDNIYLADLNIFDFDRLPPAFDCIICSHVLEHLYEPWDVVKKLEQILLPGGRLIIALPNVLYYKQRLQFLLGRFRYSKAGGLMDNTHFRFFDWESALTVLEGLSLTLLKKEATGNFPLPLLRKWAPGLSKRIDKFFVTRFPGLFGFQILMVAIKK